MLAPRRALALIVLGSLAGGMLAVATPARARICGDADANDRVTDTDAVLIFRRAANLPSPCKALACDTDGDGRITEEDARRILRKASGLAIVERCGLGDVAGRVLIGETEAADTTEREPNDLASVATPLGRLGAETTLTGRIDPSTDPFDGWVVPIEAPMVLGLELRFRRGADVDLLVVDPLTDAALTCEGTAAGRERCAVHVDPHGDTRALHVVVAAAGSLPTAYTLTIRPAPARPGPDRLAPGRGAGAPRAIEPAVYAGREADFIPGEMIVQPGAATDAAETSGGATARLRAARGALAALDLAGRWQPAVVTPSGATLCTHVGGRRDDAADATKAARGALRRETRAAIARLRREPGIAWAQPNYVARTARAPNDPLLPRQWHYQTLGLEAAWDLTIGDDRVIVAVVDTGIRSDHPDLAARLVPGYDFITDRRRANDGDGPDPDPFDPGDMPGSALEGSFHGTHVTGTIAALTDNANGIAGVTWRTRAMPLRALGVGGGSTFDIAEAIRFAAGLENVSGQLPDERATVINLSLVAFGDDPFMRAAVDAATAAGVLVVSAAGNTGSDVVVSPAVYENTLTVTASDALGAPARYAAFGPTIDLIAPGGDTTVDRNADGETDGVLSTVLPGSRDFRRFQGTSMAAAHVSGIAALVLARAGPLSPRELRAVLLASADDRGAPGRDDRYGFGLVDAAAAIRLAAGLASPTLPALALDSPALSFGPVQAALGLHARNAGGGTLTLATPSVSTTDGLDWLAATLDDDPTLVRIRTDRALLVPGAYNGRVTIRSNGGTHTLPVTMQVAPRPPVDVGPVTVSLVDPADGRPIAEVVTTFTDAYSYRFERVHGGEYGLRANTDRDHDGAGCDVGELCGAFPTLATPRPITVTGGATLAAPDFVLGTVSAAP